MSTPQLQEGRSIVLPDTVIRNDDVLPGILLPWLGASSLRSDSLRFTRISHQTCQEATDHELHLILVWEHQGRNIHLAVYHYPISRCGIVEETLVFRCLSLDAPVLSVHESDVLPSDPVQREPDRRMLSIMPLFGFSVTDGQSRDKHYVVQMVHNYLEPQYGQRVFEIAREGVPMVTWMDSG